MRDLIQIVEAAGASDGFLYHLTDQENVPAIVEHGFDPGTYFGRLDIIRYYTRMKLHKGNHPVVFRIPLGRFSLTSLEPDWKGIQDPPSVDVLEMTDDEIEEAWEASAKNWEASLSLIGSVRYAAPLHVTSKDLFTEQKPKRTAKKARAGESERDELLRLAVAHHADRDPAAVRDKIASLDDMDLPTVLAHYRSISG